MRLLISGYGGKSGDTAGIYDTAAQKFIWRSGVENISFMCMGDGGAFFGAGEYDAYGYVYMFTPVFYENGSPGGDVNVRGENCRENMSAVNGYKLAGKVRVEGKSLCHISYSAKHKILTGACYGSGDIFSLEVLPGGFGKMKSYIRQGKPEEGLTRAHCVVFGGDENELYSANIALDRIYRYEIEGGCLRETGFEQLNKGAGPRHILMIRDRRYVITEYSNEIIALDAENNHYRRMSALPEGFAGESYCSGICFLPYGSDNKYPRAADAGQGYLYAANRGADTVAVFKLNAADGTLDKIHDCPCGGNWPRHIEIIDTEDGYILAAANQHSGEVVLFEINADGSLGAEQLKVPYEGASYVTAFGAV